MLFCFSFFIYLLLQLQRCTRMQKKNNKYNHYYNKNSLNQQSIDSIILYSIYQRKESRVKHTQTHTPIYTRTISKHYDDLSNANYFVSKLHISLSMFPTKIYTFIQISQIRKSMRIIHVS